MKVLAVDIGKKKRKSVGCLMESTDKGLEILAWVEHDGDVDSFCRRAAALAAEHGCPLVAEDQYIGFIQATIELIEVKIWLKVRCMDAGVPFETVPAQTWQTILKLSGIKGTKTNKKTKEKARKLANMLWPYLQLTEDQIDAALIAVWRLRFAKP